MEDSEEERGECERDGKVERERDGKVKRVRGVKR